MTASSVIPGELLARPGEIELNVGRKTVRVTVANTGDRPIQVGSHFHFFETNEALAIRSRGGTWLSTEHRGRHCGALRAGAGAQG